MSAVQPNIWCPLNSQIQYVLNRQKKSNWLVYSFLVPNVLVAKVDYNLLCDKNKEGNVNHQNLYFLSSETDYFMFYVVNILFQLLEQIHHGLPMFFFYNKCATESRLSFERGILVISSIWLEGFLFIPVGLFKTWHKSGIFINVVLCWPW